MNTCKKYLEFLEINLTFEAIKSLSKWKFKRLMKEKIEKAAFTYLIGLKNKIGRDGRVSKIAKIISNGTCVGDRIDEESRHREECV